MCPVNVTEFSTAIPLAIFTVDLSHAQKKDLHSYR